MNAATVEDSLEPYHWTPGTNYASRAITYTDTDGDVVGMAAWVLDFHTAYTADNTLRAVLVIPIPA